MWRRINPGGRDWRGLRAFTLTDVAATVAGAGLLATTLVPSAPRGKEIQARLVDADNLRQLEFACQMYAGDNAGFEPAAGWGATTPAWLYAANPPSNPGGWNSKTASVLSNQWNSVRQGELWPYLRKSKVFLCPMDSTNSGIWAQRNVLVTSYLMNGAVSGFGQLPQGGSYKLAQFGPDRVQFWEADDSSPFSFNDGSSYPNEGVSRRHDEGTVVGDFGGSAEFISYRYFYNQAGSGGQPVVPVPNRFWCDPSSANGGL
jgi:hypothetical protein